MAPQIGVSSVVTAILSVIGSSCTEMPSKDISITKLTNGKDEY